MTFQIWLLFGIIAAAVVLFTTELVPVEVTGIGVLLAVVLTGLVPTREALSGFGSDVAIMILSLLILNAAMIRTGVVNLLGRWILNKAGEDQKRMFFVILITETIFGAFLSNTATTAFFVPVVLALAARIKVSPSKFLMPVAFASIISSQITLISTSSNVIVSGIMGERGMPQLGMFEMAPIGAAITIVGLIYLLTIGRRLVPERANPNELPDPTAETPYSTEIVVLPDSPLIGQRIKEVKLGVGLNFKVHKMARRHRPLLRLRPRRSLEEGDVLLVEGPRDDILQVRDTLGIDLNTPVVPISENNGASGEEENGHTAEAVILPGSPLIGRTLKRMQFTQRFGVQVLGVSRNGQPATQKLSQVQFRVGDQLLLQGNMENIAMMARERNFRIVGELEAPANTRRAPLAIAIFAGVFIAASFSGLPVSIVMLIGAFLVMVTRCITPQEAYQEVEWRSYIFIGSMLALGKAMQTTGADTLIARMISTNVGTLIPTAILGAFFLITVLLVQPLGNQAAAVVITPVAIQAALNLDLNPRTFAVLVAVAASCSYITPLEPSCLMVYGPGRYRFTDFLRVGSLLTLLIMVLAVLLVPIFWPF